MHYQNQQRKRFKIKFQVLIKGKITKNKDPIALTLSDAVFILNANNCPGPP